MVGRWVGDVPLCHGEVDCLSGQLVKAFDRGAGVRPAGGEGWVELGAGCDMGVDRVGLIGEVTNAGEVEAPGLIAVEGSRFPAGYRRGARF